MSATRRPTSDIERGVTDRRHQRERALRARRIQRVERAEREPITPDACLATWTETERLAYARDLHAAGWQTWEIEALTGLTARREAA